MASYNAVRQQDDDHDADSTSSASPTTSPRHLASSPIFTPPLSQSVDGLFLDNTRENSPSTSGISQVVKSIASRSTKTSGSYDMLDDEDYEEVDAQQTPPAPIKSEQQRKPNRDAPDESFVPLHIPRPHPRRSQATVDPPANLFTTIRRPHPLPSIPQDEAIPRTASGRTVPLRHPTPDLQTLQGAYAGNIRSLEATAERLSMTSSIEDAIRDLHMEQKRSDSRRSSLLSGSSLSASHHEMPPVTRQFSNTSNSIIEMNKISRSGGTGYSPGTFIKSPKGSLASKSSRYGTRPEPELEGRPLDSFVTTPRGAASIPAASPIVSRSASIAERDEETGTMTRPITDIMETPEERMAEPNAAEDRPKSPAPSTNTFAQAEKEFADFDGVHTEYEERSKTPSQMFAERTVSQLFADTVNFEEGALDVGLEDTGHQDNSTRRISTGNRLSMTRPQTYADPDTGQQMVYYPAPVPMMLNLPQKLSKLPSSMARNKRRSQVLSSLPPAARESAIWLPDVLEGEGGTLAQDPSVQEQEYVAQHQRMNMGGRRTTQDLKHLPPQLRASAYFDQPAVSQVVELKEQSAVATLDSILDASAHAPVSAFTDHAFAGHLGAEVYGKPSVRNSRSGMQLLGQTNEQQSRKRVSSFNMFKGRRASSSDLLPANKQGQDEDEDHLTESTPLNGSQIGDLRDRVDGGADEEAIDDEDDDQGMQRDDMYQGAPTTLLAELQMRKQQQKYRTRPLAAAYPNGMHSTLLEMDAVLQVEQKSRKQGRVKLAWEGLPEDDVEDDEDVPLGVLYNSKVIQERNRPLGLMERKERDDNEPLSSRRDRLQGRRPGMPRSATMLNVSANVPEDEDETLAQRVQRLKAQGGTATGLPPMPTARPVSGEFASELMSQFGTNTAKVDIKGKGKEISTSPPPDEEETLGQRRKRLQAERDARAKEVGKPGVAPEPERPETVKRRSMADILQAHPAAGANRSSSYSQPTKPPGGLLGLHEQQKSARRSSTLLNFENAKPPPPPINTQQTNMFNQGGVVPAPNHAMYNQYSSHVMYPQFAQPSMNFNMYRSQMLAPFANPYAMGYKTNAMQLGYMPNMQANPMSSMLQMGNGVQPLNQGQIDMVERWRQSVMQ